MANERGKVLIENMKSFLDGREEEVPMDYSDIEYLYKALQAQADGDLISRQSLYNKIAEMEEFSKLDLLETKPQIDGKININYAWYLAKLMDRTRFLKMIADEPSVKGENK